jgi:hypothetical protein
MAPLLFKRQILGSSLFTDCPQEGDPNFSVAEAPVGRSLLLQGRKRQIAPDK